MDEKPTTPAPLPAEPVYTNVDDAGNELPIATFTDLAARTGVLVSGQVVENPVEGLPEAAGVCFADLAIEKRPDGGMQARLNKVGVTSRAGTAISSLENLIGMLARIEQMGVEVLLNDAPLPAIKLTQASNAPTGTPAVKPGTAPATKAPSTKAPVAPPPAQQAAPAEPGVGHAAVIAVVVKPEPNNQVSLHFIWQGHRFPDVHTFAQSQDDALAVLLKSGYEFEPLHLQVVTETKYELVCGMAWVNSKKTNQNGRPYKNLVQLYPLTDQQP